MSKNITSITDDSNTVNNDDMSICEACTCTLCDNCMYEKLKQRKQTMQNINERVASFIAVVVVIMFIWLCIFVVLLTIGVLKCLF